MLVVMIEMIVLPSLVLSFWVAIHARARAEQRMYAMAHPATTRTRPSRISHTHLCRRAVPPFLPRH